MVTALALVVSAALVVAGCSGGGAGASTSADIDRSAVLRFANQYGAVSFDPHRTPSPSTDAMFQRNVYDTLVTQAADDDGKAVLEPRLATEWTIADDAKTIDFTLREGVRFQDGTEFNAAAVKANLDRARDPQSKVSSYLETLDTVEVVDPAHVRLHLSEGTPDLIWLLAGNTVGNMASPAAFNTDLATKPVGTGPYTLTTFSPNEVKLTRWDGYWNFDEVELAGIDYSIVPDDNARLSGLRSNQFDVAPFPAPGDMAAKRLVDSNGFQWQDALAATPLGLYLNQTKAPFDNPDVRRAIYLAIDRTMIAEGLFSGSVLPTGQFFSPISDAGWNGDIDVEASYDPDEARKLIRAAGAEGARVTIAHPQVAVSMTLAQALQDQLGKIGLDVQLIPYSATESLQSYLRGETMAAVQSPYGSVDPRTAVEGTLLGDRNLGTPSPEVVRLAQDAETYPVGSAERNAAYIELNDFVAANPENFVPIFIQRNGLLLSSKVVLDRKNLFSEATPKIDWVGVGLGR
ncbi:ABC transporter substrate-binding protein [Rhodococcus rhodochrous]|uniref:ABC transporter substrate-binding protein n=1 Tax=Rhodococcus rhodochrous TaxID=1829 RepID=UPI001E3BBC76|nr:ABC transporter substrate-binding protein [Rhodococcus rhodochrous]